MAAGRARPHENVRMLVAEHVRGLTRDVLRRILESGGLSGLDRFKAGKLLELVESVEYWRVVAPQEVAAGRGYIDMDLFGRVIFELKGRRSEFREAREKIERVYLPSHPRALYAVVTDYEYWEIYDARGGRLRLVEEGPRGSVEGALKAVIEDVLKSEGFRVPPRPEAISTLYRDLAGREAELQRVFESVKGEPLIRPLYESFKAMVSTLYGDAGEDFIESLYIKHTILQMIVLATLTSALKGPSDPVEACSGAALSVEVALPYLNWWHVAYTRLRDRLGAEGVRVVEELAGDIAMRAGLIDWDAAGSEDVFRELYELLIDRETRRRIGEYYTPLWLVEYVVGRVKGLAGGLRGRVVLDPFCGSGTFLVTAFHEKVREGASPDEALREVVGYDINPLAVSIARAELLLAYIRATRSNGEGPGGPPPAPMIFHTDTLYSMFKQGIPPFHVQTVERRSIDSYGRRGETSPLEGLILIERRILDRVAPELAQKVAEVARRPWEALTELLRLEAALAGMLREALASCQGASGARACLRERIEGELRRFLDSGGLDGTVVGSVFRRHLLENADKVSDGLADLLDKYGDGVWAASIVSILAPLIVKHVKPDIIVTNPPWLQLTKFKTPYAKHLTDTSIRLVGRVGVAGRSAGSVVQGSDLSSLALYGALEMAREVVAFVMPREASFYAGTQQRSGILLTYSVIKSFEDRIDYVEMIDVDFDAFQHGSYPALVFVKLKSSRGGWA